MRGPLLTLACLSAAGAIAPGCGGGSEHHDVNPDALLREAFTHPVSSANVEANLGLQVPGNPVLAQPVRVKVEGPYVSGHGVAIPSFDWSLGAMVAGFGVGGRLISSGQNVFLTIYGDNYEVGTATVAAANRRLQTQTAAAGQAQTLFGLHPQRWFGPSRYEGSEEAGGTDSAHLVASLRGNQVAADLAPLNGRLGLAAAPVVTGTVEAWVGFDDHLLHELKLDARIAPPADAPAAARTARVTADVVLSDVGKPQTISVPRGGGYKPIRDLLLTLNDLGVPGLGALGLL